MSLLKDRAKELLSATDNQELVATALGVSPGTISEWMADPEFAKDVTEKRFVALQQNKKRDDKYDEMEDAFLTKLKELAVYIVKPREVLHALAVLNNAKRRAAPISTGLSNIQGTVVSVTIPQILKQTFIVSGDNQVIQVGDKVLVTASPQQVLELKKQNQTETEIIDGDRSSGTFRFKEKVPTEAESG